MNITGITICRIIDGKIVEQWGNPDLFSMMQQLGALPAPEPKA
jgi:predicted ester cyclase